VERHRGGSDARCALGPEREAAIEALGSSKVIKPLIEFGR
jgi:hypothetical protein